MNRIFCPLTQSANLITCCFTVQTLRFVWPHIISVFDSKGSIPHH